MHDASFDQSTIQRAVVRDIQNIREQIQSRVEGDDKELNGTKQEVQEVLKGRIINEMK